MKILLISSIFLISVFFILFFIGTRILRSKERFDQNGNDLELEQDIKDMIKYNQSNKG